MSKVLFSGAQTSGKLHIGNYIGSLLNYAKLAKEYKGLDKMFMLADMHSLNTLPPKDLLKQNTEDLLIDIMSTGLFDDVNIFKQSAVSQHCELATILATLVPFGALSRMTQFKDKTSDAMSFVSHGIDQAGEFASVGINKEQLLVRVERKNGDFDDYSARKNFADSIDELVSRVSALSSQDEVRELLKSFGSPHASKKSINAGLFSYPVLQAADILLYKANEVPVGDDQRQHLELVRDVAKRFNKVYKAKTLVIPKAVMPTSAGRIMSLSSPNNKMSKTDPSSLACIYLRDTNDNIAKKIKKSVTDSEPEVTLDPSRKGIYNLLTIGSALENTAIADFADRFIGGNTSSLKLALIDLIVKTIEPIRERADYLINNKDEIKSKLRQGNEMALDKAQKTMQEVKELIGI